MEIFVISCDGYLWERAYTSLNDAKKELQSRGFLIDFNSLQIYAFFSIPTNF